MVLLRSQAKDHRSPIEFRDYVKEPFEYGWKEEVANLISLSSAVIVVIAQNTHERRAVNWEMGEAHRQGRLVIGMRLHRNRRLRIPRAMDPDDTTIYWNTDDIAGALEDGSDGWRWRGASGYGPSLG